MVGLNSVTLSAHCPSHHLEYSHQVLTCPWTTTQENDFHGVCSTAGRIHQGAENFLPAFVEKYHVFQSLSLPKIEIQENEFDGAHPMPGSIHQSAEDFWTAFVDVDFDVQFPSLPQTKTPRD